MNDSGGRGSKPLESINSSQHSARAVLEGLARLGGTRRSIEEIGQAASLPVAEVACLLTGPNGRAGLEGLNLVSVRRTKGGGLEVTLTERAEATE